ncbi:MAG TPA: TetR/AcrR family transcriptional regulator [Streptosporangiaceae bacterium]
MTSTRMSAEERRESVLDAAVAEFAKGGLAGTSTEAIAARAGISQPYLFRLFSTKKDLFIAAYRRAFTRIESRFTEASEGLTGNAALDAMAEAYHDLLTDRDLLLCQLHTYAACGDADVQEAARSCYGHLWRMAEARSGVDSESLRIFFAMGMLWNVAVALDLPDLSDAWARAIMSDTPVRSGEGLGGGPDCGAS